MTDLDDKINNLMKKLQDSNSPDASEVLEISEASEASEVPQSPKILENSSFIPQPPALPGTIPQPPELPSSSSSSSSSSSLPEIKRSKSSASKYYEPSKTTVKTNATKEGSWSNKLLYILAPILIGLALWFKKPKKEDEKEEFDFKKLAIATIVAWILIFVFNKYGYEEI